MAKDSHQRFATAGALSTAARAALTPMTVDAPASVPAVPAVEPATLVAETAVSLPTHPAPVVEHVLTGHTWPVTAVVTTQLDGRPVAVSASVDRTLRIWDLNTSQPVGPPLKSASWWQDLPTGVTTTQLYGRPVAVSYGPGSLPRVWDLATGQPIGLPLIGHAFGPAAMTQLDGRPVALSVSKDKTLRGWDLTTGQLIGPPLTGYGGYGPALVTQLDGRLLAVSATIKEKLC